MIVVPTVAPVPSPSDARDGRAQRLVLGVLAVALAGTKQLRPSLPPLR